MPQFGGAPKCTECGQSAYANESVQYDQKPYHKNCFKCKECHKALEPRSVAQFNGTIYCKNCFKKLFKARGKYDDIDPSAAPKQGGGAPPPAAKEAAPAAAAPAAAAPAAAKPAAAAPAAAAAKPAAAAAADAKKGSVTDVNDRIVAENFSADQKEPIVIKATPKSSVFIGNSKGTANQSIVFQVVGKCKSLTVSGLEFGAVVCEDVIAAIELVRCKRIQFQSSGLVPTLNIDQSERCSVFVNESKIADAQIVTAKSDSINVSVIPDGDADPFEIPLPEQLVHKWDGKAKKVESHVKALGEGE